jgi:hypothetical protein
MNGWIRREGDSRDAPPDGQVATAETGRLEHARRMTLRLRSTARRSRSRVMLPTIMQAIDMNPRTKATMFPKRD